MPAGHVPLLVDVLIEIVRDNVRLSSQVQVDTIDLIIDLLEQSLPSVYVMGERVITVTSFGSSRLLSLLKHIVNVNGQPLDIGASMVLRSLTRKVFWPAPLLVGWVTGGRSCKSILTHLL